MTAGIIVTLVASWFLVGLSFTVAVVVYPSFRLVDELSWPAFHRQHSSRITWVVGPPWLAQAAGLGVWLLAGPRSTWWEWATCSAGAVLAVILTIVVAVPAHQQLGGGFDPMVARRLLTSHWLRTMAWVIAAVAATVGVVQIT